MITLVIRILFGLFLLAFIGYALSRRRVSGNNIGNTGKTLLSWLEKDWVQLTAMWMFLVFILPILILSDDAQVPYRSLRSIWWSLIFSTHGLLLTLGLVMFGYFMPSDPKKPFRLKLAKFGMVVLVVMSGAMVWKTFSTRIMGGEPNSTTASIMSWWNGNKPPTTTTTTMPATSNSMRRAETQDFVTTFWYQNLPIGDAREMINIAQCESEFKHWDDNGNVVVNTNDDGSTDTCVMQVNSIWQAKADELGHNLKTLNGCLQMALYIRKEKGAQEWTGCYSKVKEVKDEVTLIPAPAQPEWSPVQKAKANCIWENDVPLDIRDDSGKVHRKNPGEIVNVITWTFEISVPEGSPPGTMRYICR